MAKLAKLSAAPGENDTVSRHGHRVCDARSNLHHVLAVEVLKEHGKWGVDEPCTHRTRQRPRP